MPPSLVLKVGPIRQTQLGGHYFLAPTNLLGIENYPDFCLHDAPVQATDRLRVAEPSLAGGIYILIARSSDIDRHAPGLATQSSEAKLRYRDVYDAIPRIRWKTDWPLEPVKMKIATADWLEAHLVSKNDPSKGTGDLLTQILATIRQHVENARPGIETERCLPSGTERPPRRSVFAELEAALRQFFNIYRILHQQIGDASN